MSYRNQTNLVLLENKTDNASCRIQVFRFWGGFFSFGQVPVLLKTKPPCKEEKILLPLSQQKEKLH